MTNIARVVVDVTGVDKQFDYLIPSTMSDSVVVGSRVRVPLHHREVSGWVVDIVSDGASDVEAARLLSLVKVSSIGPGVDIVRLVDWAAVRWASRKRPFLVSASPERRIHRLGTPRYSAPAARHVESDADGGVHGLCERGGGVLHCGPATSDITVVLEVLRRGPSIVVVPTVARARRLAAECRHRGFTTALYPDEWSSAASGVDVVVGARSAVWASVPKLSAMVVLDEHDDVLQEERAPTWHAREVAIERAARAAAPCVLVSPVPTVAARQWAGDRIHSTDDAARWPQFNIVDRTRDERWARSLVTSELVHVLRDTSKRVVCVLNVKGRARVLACDSCRAIARCESCGASVTQPSDEHFECSRCHTLRPIVCVACGSQKMRAIRVGISRLREELEAAAGRSVQEVTPTTAALDPRTSVFVGTEAVLHRVERADVVVFLDIDSELLAPRFRSSEQALDLLVHGARLVARTNDVSGQVLVQTSVPTHEVLVGLAVGDLGNHVEAETERRRRLSLPPFGALAEISGKGAKHMAETLSTSLLVQVAVEEERVLVRAASWDDLSNALTEVDRPKERVRIAVDPPRA